MEQHLQKYRNLVADFNTPQQYLNWLMELGKKSAVSNRSKFCVKENFVRGCQDDVWITVESSDTSITVLLDSDAQIVRGAGSVICSIVANCTKDQVAKLQYSDFKEIFQYLPVLRQRGIQIILNKIQQLCV